MATIQYHTIWVFENYIKTNKTTKSSSTLDTVLTLSEKKVQKLSLGLYLFKRYTFVPKGCILVP